MADQMGFPEYEFRTDAILQDLRKHLAGSDPSDPANNATLKRQAAESAHASLRHIVHELQTHWHVRPQPFVSRHLLLRKTVGPFWNLWGRLFYRWYLPALLQQQVEFNAGVVRLAQHLEQLVVILADEGQAVGSAGSAEDDHALLELSRGSAQQELVLRKAVDEIAALRQHTAEADSGDTERRLARLEALLPLLAPSPGAGYDQETEVARDAPADAISALVFGDRFRGSFESVMERQRPYLEYFAGKGNVLDLGCGRGEFLRLLQEAGVPGKGVDSDAGVVASCQASGLDVVRGDLFDVLTSQADGSIGGVFSAQVIEHLPPAKILRLFRLAYDKLAPGGVLLAETINPMCLLALASHYTIDLTHRQPVHPDTAAFLAESIGFREVQVRFCSLVPERGRLQPVPPVQQSEFEPWRALLNENVRKLNDLLFTYQEYALVARKPSA